MQLNITSAEFKAEITLYLERLAELSRRQIADEKEFIETEETFRNLINECGRFITVNSSPDIAPGLLEVFRPSQPFQIQSKTSPQQKKALLQKNMQELRAGLDHLLAFIQMSDPLREGTSFTDERADMTVDEKRQFLLMKLYELRKSNSYWEAAELFEYNQVNMDTYDEAREICIFLKDRGLVDGIGSVGGFMVRITSEGKALVEHSVKQQNQDSSDSSPISLDIFISHSSLDLAAAGLLVTLLKSSLNLSSQSIRCSSLDGYRLSAGSQIDEQLKKEVHGCKVLIGLISANSAQSAYVLFELGARWGASKPLIPLLIEQQGAEILKGPLKSLNTLSAWLPAQMYQVLQEVSKILDKELESPPVFSAQLDALTSFCER